MACGKLEIDILNTIPSTCASKYLPNKLFTICNNTNTAKTPDIIPSGIPIIPNNNPSKITFFFICFLVAPTLASIE